MIIDIVKELFSGQRQDFMSLYSRAETLERIRATSKRPYQGFSFKPTMRSYVIGDYICVYRVPAMAMLRPWPVYYGRIRDVNGHAEILGQFKIGLADRVVLVLWCALCVVGTMIPGVGLVYQGVGSSRGQLVSASIAALLFLSVGVLLALFGIYWEFQFRKAGWASKNLVIEYMLEATKSTPNQAL